MVLLDPVKGGGSAQRMVEACIARAANLTMRATRPTAGPAHSFFQFRANPLDVLSPGFRLLNGDNPAYPFIACQLRDIFPLNSRRGVGNKSLSQIRRYVMNHA